MRQLTPTDLLTASAHQLREAFRGGHAIDNMASLDDTEYRGVSLGLPRFVERLTWKKFKKVFHRDPDTGHLRGWNVRLEQNELDGPCIAKVRRGAPFTFGHFRVIEAPGRKLPVPGKPSLILDYGLGENSRLDFMRCVRDPLVALSAGDSRVLLGCMYVELGPICLPTPSFFTLEYDSALTDVVRPPGRR
ncbi:MAG: hypothetical protein IPI67_10090 [Myxococcales bacterium]|nr:hypothetical protein [Myxococcales bacterium]